MPLDRTRHLLCSAAAGCVWGGVAWLLAHRHLGPIVWGGVLASPAIGLVIGALFAPIHALRPVPRALLALVSLYAAATLFGLCCGLYDSLRPISGRIPQALVWQAVLGVWWGMTFTGYVVLLWPLAVVTHRAVGRAASPPA